MRSSMSVGLMDRVFSCLSYLSAGWVGLILLILFYFLKRKPSKFLLYNVFQAIFVSLLLYVISAGLGYLLSLLSFIPFLNYIISNITFFFSRGIFLGYSILQVGIFSLIIYMALISLSGKLPRIYWVSSIIDRQV